MPKFAPHTAVAKSLAGNMSCKPAFLKKTRGEAVKRMKMMSSSDIINVKLEDATSTRSRFKDLINKKQQASTKIFIYHQVSTDTHHYYHKEVSGTMPYLTESKMLPRKESVDTIMSTLTDEEKKEFLHELLYASMNVVLTGKAEYIETLRQIIVAWEYTAHIAANPELAKDIADTRQEIENDQAPGIEWRELLRG